MTPADLYTRLFVGSVSCVEETDLGGGGARTERGGNQHRERIDDHGLTHVARIAVAILHVTGFGNAHEGREGIKERGEQHHEDERQVRDFQGTHQGELARDLKQI